jgi:hypothetical protein
LAGALLFDEKSAQMLLYFGWGLRDAGIIYSQTGIQRTIYVSHAFLEHSSVEKIAV